MCEKNWGTKIQTLTCHEFLNHCRKLYNFHVEKLRLDLQVKATAPISNGPMIRGKPESQLNPQTKGVYDVMPDKHSQQEDARTRSSTNPLNLQMNSNLSAHASRLEAQTTSGSKQKLVKIKRKIVCAIASTDKNENVDLWLTMGSK